MEYFIVLKLKSQKIALKDTVLDKMKKKKKRKWATFSSSDPFWWGRGVAGAVRENS